MSKTLRRFFRIGILVLVIICLIGGAVFLVQQKKKDLSQTPAYGAKPRPVTVVKAKKGDLTLEKQYLAIVDPTKQAVVSAKVTAVVEKILVDEDDLVKAGEVLAELDAIEVGHAIDAVSSRIEQAEAELDGNRATVAALKESHEYWQTEKKRDLSLAEKGAIPKADAQQTVEKAADAKGKFLAAQEKTVAIEKEINALKKQKAELLTRRGYYTLKSPFDGVVTGRLVDPGDMAAPSKILFTVQDQSGVKIAFDVPQKDLPQVQPGMTVTFHDNDGIRKSEIRLMVPALTKAKMMRAEIWLDQAAATGLNIGAYLPVTVIVEQLSGVILLPVSTLIESSEGKTHVFAVTEGSIIAKPVEILGRAGDMVAVKGIDADTQAVENTYLGWATLSSGQKVKAVQ